MMIGNGQWVTTRDEASVELFLEEMHMQERLEAERGLRRSQWRRYLLLRWRRLLHLA